MSEPMDPAFAEHFRKIQLNFIDGLPQRLEEIQQALDDHQRYVALHRLAGAAGGYGFPRLGDIARDAMQAMQPDSKAALDDILIQLAVAMDSVIRS